MALNFFYNTGVDAQNVLYFDEPWSRPGDYVLLRALTDMVCVSSACPDDIDPANGWNPTDIHVRTYSDKQSFSRAVAYRMTPDAEPKMTRETAFHPRISALTRNFVEYRGYWLPTAFNNDGPVDEYWACREKAAVMDLSPLRKFEVTGPDAEALLQYALHAQRAKARHRAGGLYRDVLRAWRHDRRRHAVPPRRSTISAGSAATTIAASGCASRPRSSG